MPGTMDDRDGWRERETPGTVFYQQDLIIYIYIYERERERDADRQALVVMFIVVRNGHGDQSSNPELVWLDFT